MLQIPRNTADNPLRSTDAGSKMLRGIQGHRVYLPGKFHIEVPKPCKKAKRKIQRQNRLNPMPIACSSSQAPQILYK